MRRRGPWSRRPSRTRRSSAASRPTSSRGRARRASRSGSRARARARRSRRPRGATARRAAARATAAREGRGFRREPGAASSGARRCSQILRARPRSAALSRNSGAARELGAAVAHRSGGSARRPLPRAARRWRETEPSPRHMCGTENNSLGFRILPSVSSQFLKRDACRSSGRGSRVHAALALIVSGMANHQRARELALALREQDDYRELMDAWMRHGHRPSRP